MVNKKNIKVLTKKVSVFYGDKQAIKDVNLEIFEKNTKMASIHKLFNKHSCAHFYNRRQP